MFTLSQPWWEFVVRGVCVYAVLIILVRLSGKRTVGQFTPFDLLVVMLISEAVSGSLAGEDTSLVGGLLVAGTLVAVNMLLAFVSTRSQRLEEIVEGVPVLLARDGRIFEQVLKRHRVGRGEVERSLRENDCELSQMATVYLEADGQISVQKRRRADAE
jgi:uncharacterized membrane protein YcaP (DUF421 family)